MNKKYPKCFGKFSKCPLEKRIFCVKGVINVAEKCRREEIINNSKKKNQMYKDLNGKIWICASAKVNNENKE